MALSSLVDPQPDTIVNILATTNNDRPLSIPTITLSPSPDPQRMPSPPSPSPSQQNSDYDSDSSSSESGAVQIYGGSNRSKLKTAAGADVAAMGVNAQEREIRTMNDLHPYVQTLSLADLDSCVALENAAFSEEERCSREKFIYRLSACSHLSLGLFSTFSPPYPSLPTTPPARPPFSHQPQQKSVLIAHVVATMTDTPHVTNPAMDYPLDWNSSDDRDDPRGHREKGRTLAVHSVAVIPEYQKMKLGETVMKAYLQRMSSARVADRVSLLAHREFVGFYTKLGFQDEGISSSELYGGGWVNMVHDLIL